MDRNEITVTQLRWMIHALQREMASVRDEMEHASDGSPIVAFGEVVYEGRANLVTKLEDIIESGYKTIKIRK